MDWRERYERAAARYAAGEARELDERQLVQLANSAWAAGLSLLMAGDRGGAAGGARRGGGAVPPDGGGPGGRGGVAAAVGGAISRELGGGRFDGCVGTAGRSDEG